MKKLFKKIAGYFLIGLGIIGLFTPFLQGILLIILGLSTLGDDRYKKLINKLKQKYNDRKNKKSSQNNHTDA